MSLFGIGRQFLRTGHCHNRLILRTILSSSYPCHEEWNKRLQEPAFHNVNAEEFFFQVNERIGAKLPMEPVDVDLFANVITEETHLDECIYFLQLLRANRLTVFTLDSTHHAVCRAFLALNATRSLMKILENKAEYGIFPDNQMYNMIIDHFLEKNDFRNATKVAHLYMLQEDHSNEITNILSLYSVYSCLTDSEKKEALLMPEEEEVVEREEGEEKEAEENEKSASNDQEEEDEYVRIPYIQNPCFDDHFDLKDPLLLSGKTLYYIGLRYKDDVIGRTSQLIGLAFWQKWEKANQLIDTFLTDPSKHFLAKGTTELVSSVVDSLAEPNEQATSLLEKLKANEKLQTGEHIMDLAKDQLKKIPDLEAKDKEKLLELFNKWKEDRANAIQEQLNKYMRDEKIKEIKKLRKELATKERKLYFFENFDKLEMQFDEAKKQLQELKKSQVEEEYFPPTMSGLRVDITEAALAYRNKKFFKQFSKK